MAYIARAVAIGPFLPQLWADILHGRWWTREATRVVPTGLYRTDSFFIGEYVVRRRDERQMLRTLVGNEFRKEYVYVYIRLELVEISIWILKGSEEDSKNQTKLKFMFIHYRAKFRCLPPYLRYLEFLYKISMLFRISSGNV